MKIKDYSDEIARATEYLRAVNNMEAWSQMSEAQKKYAAYLAEAHGWGLDMAIQRSFIFGYDPAPYDYRSGCIVKEDVPKEEFGF